MMARNTNVPFKGRIQKSKTDKLHRHFRLATRGRSIQMGHIAAEFWMDMFNNDADMQARFARGDATMRRRFRTAAMYLAGAHANVDPAEEAAYRARLTRGDN
jgi:hypothetical protein